MVKRLLVCLCFILAAAACKKSKFQRSSHTSKTNPTPTPEASASPSPGATPGALGGRYLEPGPFENLVVASNTALGKCRVILILHNLRSDDKDFVGLYTVHTVDIRDITFTARTPKPQAGGKLFDLEIVLEYNYKSVPEVTEYQEQQLEIKGKDSAGAELRFNLTYTSKTFPQDKPNDPPTKFLKGVEGHPQALPAG